MDTKKDKKLTKWAEDAFREYSEKYVTYDDFCHYGLEKAFIEAVRARDQYLLDTYFKLPEGRQVISPNGNEDGFVGLEDRLKVEQNYLKHQNEVLKKLWTYDKELAKKLEFGEEKVNQ